MQWSTGLPSTSKIAKSTQKLFLQDTHCHCIGKKLPFYGRASAFRINYTESEAMEDMRGKSLIIALQIQMGNANNHSKYMLQFC